MAAAVPPEAPAPADVADPGRPRSRDELDPELVALPRKRPQLGPLLCLAIVGFNGFLLARLWPDLRFARQGDTPAAVDLTSIRGQPGEAYVALHAAPDRACDLRVFASEAKAGSRLMPFLGGDGQVWLLVDGDPRRAGADGGETYQGRLKQLDELPFADALAEALVGLAPVPRALTPAAVRAALAGQHGLVDASGDQVAVDKDDEVVAHEVVPGRSAVLCYATDNHPDEETWRDALARAGVTDGPVPPVTGTDQSWTYDVAGVPDAVSAKLVAARLFSCQVDPMTRLWRAHWHELRASGDGLMLGGILVPWEHVSRIEVAAKRAAPAAGAVVLVDGERPGDYWYVLPVALVLGALALLFVWGLVRSLRGARAAPPAAG